MFRRRLLIRGHDEGGALFRRERFRGLLLEQASASASTGLQIPRKLELRRRRERGGLGETDETVDGRVHRGGDEPIDVARRAAESGAAREVRGETLVPRTGIGMKRGRDVERPGGAIRSVRCRRRSGHGTIIARRRG
jgi:hypothetical protein